MPPATAAHPHAEAPCEPLVEGPARVRVLTTRKPFDPGPGTTHAAAGARLLALAANLSPAPPIRAVQCPQVHGTTLFDADTLPAGEGPIAGPEADGLFSRQSGTMLAVRTADCVPVVLASRDGTAIAALHCGWRGTLGGLLPATVARFRAAGVTPGDLWMWIGPRICGACYEVGPELADRFRAAFPRQGAAAITADHVDLGAVLRGCATECGIPPNAIRLHPACTRESKELFPSHRRDANNRGLIYTGVWTIFGRNLA